MTEIFIIDEKKVPIKSLQYKSKDNQIDVMRNWFYANYEDPANACPYDGREGGYAYIYGGPYDANEELQDKFGGYVKDDYIEQLVSELQGECFDWSGNSNNSDWYDDDVYLALTTSDNPFDKFVQNIEGIKALADNDFKAQRKDHLLSLLYTNVITALETLFVELFVNAIDKNDDYISDFIEKGKTEFKVSKNFIALPFKGATIENVRDELVRSIKEHLISASWHNAERVAQRFKATFDIVTPDTKLINEIELATHKRNHLVHRGGKDKEGNLVVITEQDLGELLSNAMAIGENIHLNLKVALDKQAAHVETEF